MEHKETHCDESGCEGSLPNTNALNSIVTVLRLVAQV